MAPKTTTTRTLIYSHRGARGLSPENTIPAYRTSLKVGVDYVDMDVMVTKDGVVVVTHDFALNPDITRDDKGNWITGKQKLIKDLTWKELQTYDVGRLKPETKYAASFPKQQPVDGTHIPSLQEVIKTAKQITNNKVKFQIEIKTDPSSPELTFPPKYIAAAVIKVLRKEKIEEHTELQAFDWRVLQSAQKIIKKVATAYLTDKNKTKQMYHQDPKIAGLWSAGFLIKDYDDSIPKMIAKLGGKIWGPESKQLNKKNAAEAHKYGLKIVPWTANTNREMARMIELSVDGIITDRPDILRKVLAKNDYKLPPKIL
jgi:glycerophosphoryl diester phosphodiesterase